MHYEVTFKGTRAERERAASKEVKFYLGLPAYLELRRKIVNFCIDERWTTRQAYHRIQWFLVFHGIEGYWPTRAFARDVFRVLKDYWATHPRT